MLDHFSRIKIAHLEENIVRKMLFACALFSTAITAGIILVLIGETYNFFQLVSFREFFGSTEWAPLFQPQHFGIWPLVCGTFLVAFGAAIIGLPAGLGIAIFLNEYAPTSLRNVIKPVMELLAGVPTIIYGYFAMTTITPALQQMLPATEVFNAASAAIVVGIMILPMVASLCDDSLRAVPRSMKDAGYALGATKFEVSTQVAVPAALSGIIAAFILALSRAVGETMAVALAAGATPKMTVNPLESIQTMTGYIVQVSMGDTPHGSVEYESIFAVGMMLFIITLGFNMLAAYVVKRFRRVYE